MNLNLFKLTQGVGIYLLLFSALGCERYEGQNCIEQNSYFYLTESEKRLWPLTEMDSFVLVSNKGERVVHTKGTKRTDFYFENFASSPECNWRHYFEFISFFYNITGSSKRSLVSIDKQEEHVRIKPINNDTLYFFIPFSYFTPSNYKHYVQTNKGVINCLAYGDSLYYSQTEGIIKVVENDSTFWVREF